MELLLPKYSIYDNWIHVITGLYSGFIVRIQEELSHTHIYFTNHKSSQLSPNFISTYTPGEQADGHYSRGFLLEELEQLIGSFHTSPLGLMPKPNSSAFWMIQDMSFPHNHQDVLSMNHSINPDDFLTTWGTFNTTSSLILSLPLDASQLPLNLW